MSRGAHDTRRDGLQRKFSEMNRASTQSDASLHVAVSHCNDDATAKLRNFFGIPPFVIISIVKAQ